MALKMIAPATELAVSLADVKIHLRLDAAYEDALITTYIGTATEMVEQIIGRSLMLQTWELTLNSFPAAFELTRVPVSSVTSIKYWDNDGIQQTLSGNLYTLDNADDNSYAYVTPVYSGAWPSSRDQNNAVALRYVAGYATATNVPESIKEWIKLAVGSMFENRQSEVIASGSVLSLGFADRLLDRYKVWA